MEFKNMQVQFSDEQKERKTDYNNEANDWDTKFRAAETQRDTDFKT